MIVVDTFVWIDHFQSPNQVLQTLIEGDEILGHPFVVGEIALGHLPRRKST